MKLAAIYNVWDGVELLQGSINCLKEHVDLFIFVYQEVSNYGEHYNPLHHIDLNQGENFILQKYTPVKFGGGRNEKEKRNLGLKIAKQHGCTHFLNIDCDEYYEDFGKAKQDFINSGASGSVCPLFTYFKSPVYRFEREDGYYVPFIHKLNPNTTAGAVIQSEYPYYVDPTRTINQQNVVKLNHYMHHFSWIRKDIMKKINNSSAKNNLQNGTMLKDYMNPLVGEGFYVKDYEQKLIRVENKFGLPLIF